MNACGNIGIMMLFAAAVAIGDETNATSFTRTRREGIIDAAGEAAHRYMTRASSQPRGEEISKSLWGKAIEELHPVRVLFDIGNVFIVTSEDEKTQAGLYVFLAGSSYMPGDGDRFLNCELLSKPSDDIFGQIYRCKVKRPQPPAGVDEKPAPQP